MNYENYRFIEVPVGQLNMALPKGLTHSELLVTPGTVDEVTGKETVGAVHRQKTLGTVDEVTGKETVGAVHRQKTLGEFAVHKVVSVDGTKCIVMLAARTHNFGRKFLPTSDEVAEIVATLPPGLQNKTFGIEEYRVKRESPEYAAPIDE